MTDKWASSKTPAKAQKTETGRKEEDVCAAHSQQGAREKGSGAKYNHMLRASISAEKKLCFFLMSVSMYTVHPQETAIHFFPPSRAC